MNNPTTIYEALNEYKGKRIRLLLFGEDRTYEYPTIIDIRHEFVVIKVASLKVGELQQGKLWINITEEPLILFGVED